jgi:hypothetical protein
MIVGSEIAASFMQRVRRILELHAKGTPNFRGGNMNTEGGLCFGCEKYI